MSEHREIGFDEVQVGQRVRLTRKSGVTLEGVVTGGSGGTAVYLNGDFGSVQGMVASILLLDDVQPALVEGQLGRTGGGSVWWPVEWVAGRWQYLSDGQPITSTDVTPQQRKVVPLSARMAGEGEVVVGARYDAVVYRDWAKMVRARSGWHGIANVLDAVAAACDLRDGTSSP